MKKTGVLLVLALLLSQTTYAAAQNVSTGYCAGEHRMLYFYGLGCPHCEVAKYYLDDLQQDYPQMNVTALEVTANVENREFMLAYLAWHNWTRTGTPQLVYGEHLYYGDRAIRTDVRPDIEACREEGCPCVTAPFGSDYVPSQPEGGGMLTILGVATSGFIDGINPCAFAVMVFFLSYLRLVSRQKGVAELAGVAYIVGVYVTYLLLGVGLLAIIGRFGIGNVIQLPVALFSMSVGAVSLWDAYRTRRGGAEGMKLQMPARFKEWSRTLIRDTLGIRQGRAFSRRYIVGVSFVLGAVVAAFELPCTGEMYLPILSLLYHYGLAAALPFLLFYNFMFVLPLIGLFVVVLEGASSQRILSFTKKHVSLMKAATGLVLIALGCYLIWENQYQLIILAEQLGVRDVLFPGI